MRLLVIGNSHAACLIEAWRGADGAHGATEVDFFARAGTALGEFAIEGRRLYAPTAEGRAFQAQLGQKAEFDLAGYDAILVVGHELSGFRLVRILNRNHVLGWPYRNRLDIPVITEPCLRDALDDSLEDITATRLLRQIAPALSADRQRLIALPQPYPSQIILQGKAKSVGFVRLCRAQVGAQCRALFETVAQAHLAGIGAAFLPQPDETVVEGLLTGQDYTLGARRLSDLSQTQPPQDELHANARYGALIWAQVLAELGAA
ncbi:hypothetical protein [Xinfangfangia pollutisoli]|uniref:hypothetical protein n=1 Tax=Xinfangfangia pollutisoli TaxID=2865960 RepID=UPI001CD39C26|nr:hypothetical protein [Xinfangfangia pollutisoli]